MSIEKDKMIEIEGARSYMLQLQSDLLAKRKIFKDKYNSMYSQDQKEQQTDQIIEDNNVPANNESEPEHDEASFG